MICGKHHHFIHSRICSGHISPFPPLPPSVASHIFPLQNLFEDRDASACYCTYTILKAPSFFFPSSTIICVSGLAIVVKDAAWWSRGSGRVATSHHVTRLGRFRRLLPSCPFGPPPETRQRGSAIPCSGWRSSRYHRNLPCGQRIHVRWGIYPRE